jgi:hypothetical protein
VARRSTSERLEGALKQLFFFVLFSVGVFGFITFVFGRDGLPFGDAADYTNGARNFQDGQGPLLSGTWPYFRPPGYPFLIALAWKITGTESISLLLAINCTLHVLNAFLAGMISKILFGRNSQSVVTGLYLINPFLLYQLAGIQTEPIITSLSLIYLLTALFFVSNSKKQSSKISHSLILVNAFVVVFATSIRPEYLLIFVLFFPVVLFLARLSRAQLLQSLILWLTPICLSLLMWNLQLRSRVGGFVILTDATGFQFWQGTTTLAFDAYVKYFWNPPPVDLMTQWGVHISNLINQFQAEYQWSELSIMQKAHLWQDLAFENITSNPLQVLGIFAIKFVFFLRPFLLPSAYGVTLFLVSFVWYAIWFSIVWITIRKMLREMKITRSDKDLWFAFLIFFFLANLCNTLVHTIQMADLRYRIPLLEPYMIILVGYLYPLLKQRIKRLRNV